MIAEEHESKTRATREDLCTPGDVVRWMRTQPDLHSIVANCYWDEDQGAALQRFQQSVEFSEVLRIFRRHRVQPGARVLDLGAGNGVVSHAFRAVGFNTLALEPDSCSVVGWHASQALDPISGLTVPNVSAFAEAIPFKSNTFDAVYCRQVLHHIPDLSAAAREIHRVLRPSGLLLATREHVIRDASELEAFLSHHPVHQRVGGENAHYLSEYLNPFTSAGFNHLKWVGPKESPINFFPMSPLEWKEWCSQSLAIRFGQTIAGNLAHFEVVRRRFGRWHSTRDATPGRLYSFIATA